MSMQSATAHTQEGEGSIELFEGLQRSLKYIQDPL